MTLEAGERIGIYSIDVLLGRGAMSEVYRARDTRHDRFVALKILSPKLASDAEHFARFDREVRTAALLSHPNILTVYEVGSHDGRPFLVSELLQGTTLRGRMAGGPLGADTVVGYALQIASGLAAARQMELVHRDLKPENIFVTHGGRVKILDFGLARSSARVRALPGGVLLGTLDYMSPEQIRGHEADQRSDIFSLGVMLHEGLSGSRPFQRRSAAETLHAVLHDDPPVLAGGSGITADLDRVIRRCLEKDPAGRFQSAVDLAYGLELADVAPRRAAQPAPNQWMPHKVMWLS